MNTLKRIGLLMILIAAIAVMSACSGDTSGSAADSDVIKFGVFEPLTGANAAGGAMWSLRD
ncbi:ABC-type glycerol-3-phosphate transport system substrate-binding protein [Fusibacter tunisiensis]|uniref:ABC-type glycerol-3-phosphate transport system substrate-binding protein n=1 Tax=Fusibacter tunisiensis TaxID=1008308 RepID=A0ABS2MRR9_9FIRM|nr:ABC-type glycerol-3-phosphate transport system substrate-binding protein [Fusibacter tunisiensis]